MKFKDKIEPTFMKWPIIKSEFVLFVKEGMCYSGLLVSINNSPAWSHALCASLPTYHLQNPVTLKCCIDPL